MSFLDVSLLARRIFLLGLVAVWLAPMAAAQIHQGPFTEVFPPEEFAARRAQVMDEIGDAVAILQGTIERPGEQPFRQSNQFFYLTGVEVPRAIVTIDGRSRSATLYLPPRNERRERAQGPEIYVDPEAVELTGLDAVVARDNFAARDECFFSVEASRDDDVAFLDVARADLDA